MSVQDQTKLPHALPMTQMAIWLKRTAALVAVALIGLAVAVAGYGAYLAARLELPRGEDHPPLLVYGASFGLQPGLSVEEMHLLERLNRLGYRAVTKELQTSGEYRIADDAIDLYLHGFPDLRIRPVRIRLALDHGTVTTMISLEHGDEVPPVSLEPQLISGLRGESRQVREWLPVATVPSSLVESLLLIEDRRFYWHPGLDPVAVGRAVWTNVIKGEVTQGGSTITQQLAKNLFYSPHRTWGRKFKEAIAALVLEVKYRKAEILESYVNEIYLGQVGTVSVYGVGEAAHRYFGKSAQDLTIEEVALLVGMIKGPNTYSPVRNPVLAKERRNVVLARLRASGMLTEEQWRVAVNAPVRVAPALTSLADAPYFLDYLLHESEEMTGRPFPDGARVFTTLDPVLQRIAAETLSKGLAKLEAVYPALKRKEEPLQGALVALDPKTGGILAMVGGRDYRSSQFNRAVQAKRQPGSLFKPLVYLAAFEAGKDSAGQVLTPATLVSDEPVTFESGSGTWSPQNYDRQYHGTVSLRAALEQSLNIPVVRLAHGVGVKRIAQVAKGLGIHSPLEENLSLALGSSAVSLLEATSAYVAFGQGGVAIGPTPIHQIVSAEGDPLWAATPVRQQAVSAQAAYIVTSLLKGVIERGTAAKARALGVQASVAGKTGTTDGYRDAWFVGYTPDLVVGVWVGFDDERPLALTGSQAALPIWAEFVRQVIPLNAQDFSTPSGVVTRDVDPKTGQLATSRCPERFSEVFVEGTEPKIYCELHGEGFFEQLKHSLGFS